MTADSQSADQTPTMSANDVRGRSTIEFAYFDLDSGLAVARAVKDVGVTSADLTQVAVKMQMSGDGGGFRLRVMTAKAYGLISYARNAVELTELGIRIVDPQYERAARVEAFMRVPLHKVLFEKLNGQTLPPPPAIERLIEQIGVAPKQKDKARQVFMRSAKQAGLFELSAERLSLPPSTASNGRDASFKAQDAQAETAKFVGGGEPPRTGTLRFEVPIPGKPSAVVTVPGDLDAEDWSMLSSMMTIYIERWKKFRKPDDPGEAGAL